MTHKTRAVTARLLVGGLLLGLPLFTGCGGGGGDQTNQIIKGASITKQAKVVADTGTFFVSTQPRTIYFLQDADGHNYFPSTLDPAFQKDSLHVQFTATVDGSTVGMTDGPTGIQITITSIRAL